MALWCTAANGTSKTAITRQLQKRKRNRKGKKWKRHKKNLCQKIVAFYRNGTTKHVFTFYFNIVIVIMVMKVYGFDTIKVECSYSLVYTQCEHGFSLQFDSFHIIFFTSSLNWFSSFIILLHSIGIGEQCCKR